VIPLFPQSKKIMMEMFNKDNWLSDNFVALILHLRSASYPVYSRE
jgi:hypothetical protein